MSEGSALQVRSGALPAITAEQMVKGLEAYKDLQGALDRAMPDQIMDLDGKKFRKKGYWRAVALAFNLQVECIGEKREVSGRFLDGRDNFGYVVTYKASLPGGRSMIGDGACFAVEKARRFKCPHPEDPNNKKSRRTLHFPHNTCPDFDPEFQWKTLPGDATEHNVRSHANTRAYNRAVSNLVGFGEVSAEEVERDEHETGSGEPRSAGSGRSEGAQAGHQGSQGGGQPQSQDGAAGSAGAAPGQPAGATKVKNVTSKTGTNARGPWTKWQIAFEDGRSASTFSKSDAEHAENAKLAGASVIPKIKKEGQYFNLEGFEPWPAQKKETIPDATKDEPINGPEKILTVRKTETDHGTRWFIQTDKRVLITDKEQHVEDAQEARKENMGLTPKVEVIEGKNRLLQWEETVAMHAAEAGGSAPAEQTQPAAEEGKKPRGGKKKGGAK